MLTTALMGIVGACFSTMALAAESDMYPPFVNEGADSVQLLCGSQSLGIVGLGRSIQISKAACPDSKNLRFQQLGIGGDHQVEAAVSDPAQLHQSEILLGTASP
jgi:hypothetical protein